MIIDSLAEYLEDNDIGTVGEDIFIGELPFDNDDCIALQLSPSPDPDKSIPYYTQTIDVWGRFKLYDAGYGKLQDIFDLLHRQENFEITGYHVYLAYAMGMINDLSRDVERRHLFKLSLGLLYRKSGGVS